MKYLVACCLFLLLAGCCKVYCDGTELTLNFGKFRARETDTVLFVRYIPKTGWSQVVDSFRILAPASPSDTSHSSVVRSISSAYDWKVTLPSANKQFVIENFEFTTEKCNCGGTKYKAIRSFSVNGTRKEGLYIDLE